MRSRNAIDLGYPCSSPPRAAIESIVSDSYAWFKNMVKTRRHLDDAALERVTDGRVFTGRQGLALKELHLESGRLDEVFRTITG